ncbi:MAG: DUF2723 domain-containing protein, partial [Candidatus Coatesbacteria bacterium]|nr:DUF2723 domain-containing protein [Candidatus Coatesbacteria bacterium]
MLKLDYLTDRQYILNLLTGLLLLVCYFLMSAPSVTFEDSGTLITAVVSLGVSHQPGYPLWTELTRILSSIIPGDIASSINRTSGLLFAVAFIIFAFILDEYKVKAFYKVIFTILAGLLPAFLSQAIIAEVYGFNLLLMTSCWYSAIKSRQETRWLYLFAYITGISISHHYALLPLIIPLIYFNYRKFISSKQKLIIPLSFMFMIIGSSTYILLLFHFRNKAGFDIIQIKSISGLLKYYFMFSYSNESQPFIQKFLNLSLYFLKKNIFALPYYLLMLLGFTGMLFRIYKLIKDKELFELSFWIAFSIISYLGMAYSLNSY